eukprot:TRINITY_DN46966_c0_g1_i1.p1 TRINITY_DN46966_c0_g1~~TRINITY_DN46966_c0_g1_i1.p1  ORF type:complete len:350 (-),score=62.88 TRINITY_DN46966_c0_g1_i1:55-1017(-)
MPWGRHGHCRRGWRTAIVCWSAATLAVLVLVAPNWENAWVPESQVLRQSHLECRGVRQAAADGDRRHRLPAAASAMLQRRELAASAASGLLLGLPAAPARAEAPAPIPGQQVRLPKPPKPSPDPVIRKRQEQEWKKEPYDQMRLYLGAVKQRFVASFEETIWNQKIFVHWDVDSYKFDVMDRNTFNEAGKRGLLLVDSDMSDRDWGYQIFVYKDEEARKFCQKNLVTEDYIEIPSNVQYVIEYVRRTPFPEYKPKPPRKPRADKPPEAAQGGFPNLFGWGSPSPPPAQEPTPAAATPAQEQAAPAAPAAAAPAAAVQGAK